MPARNVEVEWELAGLREGAEFFYRFRAEGAISPVGRTRTTRTRTRWGRR